MLIISEVLALKSSCIEAYATKEKQAFLQAYNMSLPSTQLLTEEGIRKHQVFSYSNTYTFIGAVLTNSSTFQRLCSAELPAITLTKHPLFKK